MRPFLPFATLLGVAFLLGCQDQASSPVGLEGLGPQFDKPDKSDAECLAVGRVLDAKGHCHDEEPPPPGDDAETFDVTVRTCNTLAVVNPGGPCGTPGNVWTDGAQRVQAAGSGGWLHIFDSGGNGTRGRPKYDDAAFSTKIFLQPATAASCVADPANMSPGLRALLFTKLNQTSGPITGGFRKVVFDFQVGYDIAENPEGFSFFLFRWEDADGTFSASTGFGLSGADPAPTLDFLGDNFPLTDDISDPTITRVFRISGAKVIAQELDKNKVIATLACTNEHIIEVTVDPVT